jgi:hypothetical protein
MYGWSVKYRAWRSERDESAKRIVPRELADIFESSYGPDVSAAIVGREVAAKVQRDPCSLLILRQNTLRVG